MQKDEREVTELSIDKERNCRAKVVNGELILQWMEYGDNEEIKLTRGETANLLDLLYNWRHEILGQ